MRKVKYKIVGLLLLFFCINSQAQQNISKIVAKEFESETSKDSKSNEIVKDLLIVDSDCTKLPFILNL